MQDEAPAIKKAANESGIGGRRNARQQELMTVATRLFNRNGFIKTRMEEIAEQLNTTPGNIYHYVSSKEELAYKCYLRSCEARRSQLVAANIPRLTGLQKIERFVQNAFKEGQRIAILGEIGALQPEWADEIRQSQRNNIALIHYMITDGIKDGSIRPVDSVLTGIGILGITQWVSFWFTRRLPYTPDEIAEQMVDIIFKGIAQDRIYNVSLPALEQPYAPAEQADPFNKKALSNLKLQLFLRTALASFNRNGVHATSIDKLVKQLNVTKGAFYYYFKNKEDLLYKCYERALAFNAVPLVEECDNQNDLEILARRALFERHTSELGPFPAYHNLTSLAGPHQNQVMQDLAEVQLSDQRRIQYGIDKGDFRKVDPFIAEKVRAGLLNWFPVWYSESGRATPSTVADSHSDLLLNGLMPK